MASFEEVQKEALCRLSTASKEGLKKAAIDIGIDAGEVTKAEGKGDLGLRRIIRRYLDNLQDHFIRNLLVQLPLILDQRS